MTENLIDDLNQLWGWSAHGTNTANWRGIDLRDSVEWLLIKGPVWRVSVCSCVCVGGWAFVCVPEESIRKNS